MRSTIVQHSFYKYETVERNGALETKEMIEGWKEYRIKFHGTIDQRDQQMLEFKGWVARSGGEYKWDEAECRNIGFLPTAFHCWCELFEHYLVEVKGFTKTYVGSKFFSFETI